MMKYTLFLIFLVFLGSLSFPQDKPQAQKNFMQFAGFWKLENAKFTAGGETMTGTYTFDCSAVNDNTGILAHEKFETKNTGTMLGENLMGYDPNTGLVHLYSTDNMGTAHDHYGSWINPEHLFLQYQGVKDGKIYLEQIDMKFISPDKMELNLTGMLNGKPYSKFSGTFTKK
ncbi:MAG: hypothetical protein WCE54_18085 [Ignavibacteriaceae bacterium]